MISLRLEKHKTPLVLRETPSSELKSGEVRIKTSYAGLSFTDLIIQKGFYKYQKNHLPLPYTPGFEAAGEVIETYNTTNNCRVGDKVLVLRPYGCFSSEIVARETEIILMPRETDLKWAASLPVNFFTAYHAVYQQVAIPPRQRILIGSAAGGVGGMLVQLTHANHDVLRVVSTAGKAGYAFNLGAQQVYLYDELLALEPFDVIFTADGSRLREYQRLLKPGGALICYGFHDLLPQGLADWPKKLFQYATLPKFKVNNLVYENKTVAGFNIIHLQHDSWAYLEATKAFLELIAAGPQETKHTITTFPVAEHQAAYGALGDRSRVGKVLLGF